MRADLQDWLATLDGDQRLTLLQVLAEQVPGAAERMATQMAEGTDDPTQLRQLVDDVLRPRRSFYRYRDANEYAREADDVVELLERTAAARPGAALLRVLERALALTVRTILRSDDSSGYQGDQIARLLDAHGAAARGASRTLTAKDVRRLVDWMIAFRYDGEQDFFDPDVVAYAPALGPDGVARYREAIGRIDLGRFGRYPLQRLAVLDRDAAAVVAAHGGVPTNPMLAERVVADLVEAGLHDEALEHARRGLAMEGAERAEALADLLVSDAVDRDDVEGALALRRDRLRCFPSSTTFDALRRTAEETGRAEEEIPAAESVLADRVGWYYLGRLLRTGRDEQAWAHALTHPADATAAQLWGTLLARRAQTDPAQTLPYYRDLVTSTLQVTGRGSYHAAAKQLLAMREAAAAADAAPEYDDFLTRTLEANRRRPTCGEIFRQHRVRPLG